MVKEVAYCDLEHLPQHNDAAIRDIMSQVRKFGVHCMLYHYMGDEASLRTVPDSKAHQFVFADAFDTRFDLCVSNKSRRLRCMLTRRRK